METQRVITRDLSTAGDLESSCSSDEENVEAKRVRVRDESPAGSAHSSSSEEEGEAKNSKNKVHLFSNFVSGRTLLTHKNVYEGLNAQKYI